MRYSWPYVTYDVILPAGGEIDADFASRVGTVNKALIQFEGKSILERIMIALKESGRIRRTVVIGPPEVHQSKAGQMADSLLTPTATGPDNIMKGLESLMKGPEPPTKVIVLTTDLPFLTADVVNAFIDASPNDADITMPVVTKEQFQARFPGCDATYIPLRDGTWTSGGMFLIDVGALRSAKPHIDRIFAVRKSKLGMARLLGPVFVYKFLRKQLTIPELEGKILSLLHCSGRAILNSPPELAYDIDDLADYEYAIKHLSS